MSTRGKLLLAGCSAALALGIAVTAHAETLSVDEQEFTMEFSSMTFGLGDYWIRCDFTMAGSFHSETLAKRPNGDVAHVTSASANECPSGERVTVLEPTFWWDLRFESFAGTLPTITSINFTAIYVNIELDFGPAPPCLFRTYVSDPLRLSVTLDEEVATSVEASGEDLLFEEWEEERQWICEWLYDSTSMSGTGTITGTRSREPLIFSLI